MKHSIKTISWKFCDTATTYPELSAKQRIIIHSPEDVFKHFNFLLMNQVQERFIVLWLSAANTIIGFEIVTTGILNSSLVHPREVFRGAIVATFASIILTHNHPSGNPEPSAEDISITKQLVEAGKIVGIPVHDHIIFAEQTYTSFAERGLI